MSQQAAILTVQRDQTETTSETVIRALSTVTDIDPSNFTPLYESIEPDALDQFFADYSSGSATEHQSVRFAHEGHVVVCRESEVRVFAD